MFDEVEYDQCPTEMESCFQSQFSSRRNTAPFSSPVLFLEEKEDNALSSEIYVSSGEHSNVIAIPNNTEKCKVPDDSSRSICTSWKPKLSDGLNNMLQENRRSLVQDNCEYHKGNSIRLRTMPTPLRASIVNSHFDVPQTGVLIKPDSLVQNIVISTPIHVSNTKSHHRSMTPITEVDTLAENGGNSVSTFTDSGICKTQSDDFLCASSNTRNKERTKDAKPPAKPPRGKLISRSTMDIVKPTIEVIRIRKSATMKCERPSGINIFHEKRIFIFGY